ncbi:hypothetical protein NW765_014483 [Fusarium oxysporum]|nr:hypothetical protein NW765_014483 [Fusarium oxysporum]
MGFITLALEEDLLNKLTTYTSPDDPKFQSRLEDWWKRIRQAAKQSKLSRYLPLEYIKMHTR